MRVPRAADLTPHALRARLSDHNLVIAAARRAKDRALVIAARLVKDRVLVIGATARVRGHDLATEIGIVVMGRDSVAADASAVVAVGRVAARSARFVSIT
jgi:hypothetical protein